VIEKIFIKNLLSFEQLDLDIDASLVVFTGPSGAGKSVLIGGLLSAFGFANEDAQVCEVLYGKDIDMKESGIENEEPNIFRYTKNDKSRYTLNAQSLPKKRLHEISKNFVAHLSAKSDNEFASEKITLLLDAMANQTLDLYAHDFVALKKAQKELQKIEEDEKKIEELKDFATFEIQKIESIDPKEGEIEELMQLKKELSKKEKIEQSIKKASGFFEIESAIAQSLTLLEEQSDFLDDFSNRLRALYEQTLARINEFDENDIEGILDRIEQLSELNRRFGSASEAIKYKELKKRELEEYENISFAKSNLQKSIDALQKQVQKSADAITKKREEALCQFIKLINEELQNLYLPQLRAKIDQRELDITGQDEVSVTVNEVPIEKVSSGEFNRIRLALLSVKRRFMASSGILILDEIDANLSGKESMSVAKVLKGLSQSYQIFAISHQPQLSSIADIHILVHKVDNKSIATKLEDAQRVQEIARIVSGDKISESAVRFAQDMLQESL
jgi:DNA repair protein RecN (Recombination protein N)